MPVPASLSLSPSVKRTTRITEANTFKRESILLPAYEFPDVKKKRSIIEIAYPERMRNRRIHLNLD